MDWQSGWKEYDGVLELRRYQKEIKDNAAWNFTDFMLRFLYFSNFSIEMKIKIDFGGGQGG